jgi:hypothetical protein
MVLSPLDDLGINILTIDRGLALIHLPLVKVKCGVNHGNFLDVRESRDSGRSN